MTVDRSEWLSETPEYRARARRFRKMEAMAVNDMVLVALFDLPQISDADWQAWASLKAEYPDVLIPSPKEARQP